MKKYIAQYVFILLLILLVGAPVVAADNPFGGSGAKPVADDPFHYNAYFRVMGRNDGGAGANTLGWWPLYGRLMNETPWFQLEMANDIMQQKYSSDPKATVVARVEGSSFRTGDQGNGNLQKFAITQFYLETVNTPYEHVVTQTGTMWYNMGYIGIYDMYVAQAFWETVGMRVGLRYDSWEAFVGAGDSGYAVQSERKNYFAETGYNSVPTVGMIAKANVGKTLKGIVDLPVLEKLQAGTSFVYMSEDSDPANQWSPHQTPGFSYADILRGDALTRYYDANPGATSIPAATSVQATYWRWTMWIGFGDIQIVGPFALKWNDLSVSYAKKPPMICTEINDTRVYISEYTDERYDLQIVDEAQFEILKNMLDLNIGLVYGKSRDGDNTVRPDDYNRDIYSLLLRPQYYITDEMHVLLEVVGSVEKSVLGNRYREHWDSMQANTAGVPDKDGLEWGDTDTKYTCQIKTGFVLNPKGRGIYNRPSIRILAGAQYSNVHAAFGNSYNESLNRQNYWNKKEDMYWHYMVSLEAEAWFAN